MFGRRGVTDRISDAAGSIAGYVDPLASDPKLRRRLAAAIAAGDAARRRVQRQTGMQGIVQRLGDDAVLRAQLRELTAQLRGVKKRQERARRQRRRNAVLFAAGVGMVTVAVVRMRRRRDAWAPEGWETAAATRAIDEEIEIGAPVSTTYSRWTELDELPRVVGSTSARIIEQEPERRIEWESADEKHARGTVMFEQAAPDRTRVRLHMSYTPARVSERVGSAVGLDARRVRTDLERFRELVETPAG
jgi:uncharacterized membrane protein